MTSNGLRPLRPSSPGRRAGALPGSRRPRSFADCSRRHLDRGLPRRSARSRAWRQSAPRGPESSARPHRTALIGKEPLGSAEITHTFHPLHGQRFPVLNIRCVSGVACVSLRHADLGSFAVPQEWTDWGAPHERFKNHSSFTRSGSPIWRRSWILSPVNQQRCAP